jgi:fructose-bisphosphate aldolase class I
MSDMNQTARAMVAPGKGILAADESTRTIRKRLDGVGVESNEENRRFYRGLLFTTEGIEEFISGVIMFDETIRQATDDGTPFPQVLSERGVIPGIKVDMGAHPLPGSPGEVVTEGLDGLRNRLAEYYELGARFAKWRAVIDIGPGIPTYNCVNANAHALARYAALCQEQNVVPIVEPEVLMDGDHTIERCYEVTHLTLRTVFAELALAGVRFDEMILKPNMVISGKKSPHQATPGQIAELTIDCFAEVVPAAVPGVVFLSGGQSEEEATVNLNEMNRRGPQPWELSFSYGRALQQSALAAWAGKPENREAAQRAFSHRARMNGLARSGSYKPELEKELAAWEGS